MKEKRGCAAAVMHNDKLHVFGGYSGSILQTTETINVDGEVSYGPDLPTGVREHAMTKINDTVSLLSGGCTRKRTASNIGCRMFKGEALERTGLLYYTYSIVYYTIQYSSQSPLMVIHHE